LLKQVKVLLDAAVNDLRERNFRECSRNAAEALRFAPECSDACLLLGLAAFRLGDHEVAIRSLSSAYNLGSKNFVGLLYLVNAFRAANAVSRANIERLVVYWMRLTTPAEVPAQMQQLLNALKPTPECIDSEEIAVVLDLIAVPTLRFLLDNKNYDAALHLEMQLYNQFVKVIETEAHFAACTKKWVPDMISAGSALALAKLPVRVPSGRRPKVAFIIHTAATEAHVEVVVNILKGYRQLVEQSFEPEVYCLFDCKPEMTAMFMCVNISVKYLEDKGLRDGSVVDRLLYLRDVAERECIDCVVWVSNPMWMAFAFALRIARKQVWFALKYHDFSSPDIDAYLTGGGMSRFKNFAGRRWRVGLSGYDGLYRPEYALEAQALRCDLGAEQGRVIAGTFGRPEKLRDPEYLGAVCGLLCKYPQLVYLWTGRSQDAGIQSTFEKCGVAAQTVFIGWVNTRLYAQVLDIFLDSFPFPCGFTLYEALMAGVPCVLMATADSLALGIHGLVSPVLAGVDGSDDDRTVLKRIFALDSTDPLLLLSSGSEGYVETAGRLIRDPSFRLKAGAAGREFAKRYFSGSERAGSSYSQHLLEIMEAE